MFLLFFTLFSWDYKTHGILGEITRNLISNNSNFKEINYLFNNNFSEASILADKLKFTKEYAWTRKLHYIDILESKFTFITDEIIKKYCKKNCITWGISYFYNQVNLNNQLIFKRVSKFRYHFLLHFLQDICQPFHLFGKTGGNDLFIKYCNNQKCKTVSIHKLWDTILPEKHNFIISEKIKTSKFKLNRYVNLHFHIALKEYNYYKSVNFTLDLSQYYNFRAKFILNDLFNNYKHLVLHYF